MDLNSIKIDIQADIRSAQMRLRRRTSSRLSLGLEFPMEKTTLLTPDESEKQIHREVVQSQEKYEALLREHERKIAEVEENLAVELREKERLEVELQNLRVACKNLASAQKTEKTRLALQLENVRKKIIERYPKKKSGEGIAPALSEKAETKSSENLSKDLKRRLIGLALRIREKRWLTQKKLSQKIQALQLQRAIVAAPGEAPSAQVPPAAEVVALQTKIDTLLEEIASLKDQQDNIS